MRLRSWLGGWAVWGSELGLFSFSPVEPFVCFIRWIWMGLHRNRHGFKESAAGHSHGLIVSRPIP